MSRSKKNRVFSCDVTAAMLVYLSNGTAAMLVYPTNPPGIVLSCKCFLLFRWENKVTDHSTLGYSLNRFMCSGLVTLKKIT